MSIDESSMFAYILIYCYYSPPEQFTILGRYSLDSRDIAVTFMFQTESRVLLCHSLTGIAIMLLELFYRVCLLCVCMCVPMCVCICVVVFTHL